jgi:hypothetical protein
MKQAEAEKLWCPMRQTIITSSGEAWDRKITDTVTVTGQVAYSAPNVGCTCVTVNCMMWRKNALDSDDGFCGLAGFSHFGAG